MTSDQNMFWYNHIQILSSGFWIFHLTATEKYETLVIKADAKNSEQIL